MPEYVPWHFTDDKVLVCLLAGDPPSKKLCTLADVMCHVTKERGITEAKLVDHVMRPKVKARPTLNHFYYWNSKLQYAKRNCGIVGQSALVSFSTETNIERWVLMGQKQPWPTAILWLQTSTSIATNQKNLRVTWTRPIVGALSSVPYGMAASTLFRAPAIATLCGRLDLGEKCQK